MLNEIMDILQDIKQQMSSDFNEMKQCYMSMNDSAQRSINTIEAVEHIIDKAEGRNGKE